MKLKPPGLSYHIHTYRQSHQFHCPLSILIDPDRVIRHTLLTKSTVITYGNSDIYIFCRQIFRHMKASMLLILVSDPWPGYTFARVPHRVARGITGNETSS
ncbi:hypothetical protein ACN38_g12968 [Penicillium nordicum]|uniref:Uncharacterized protein n=1 Tax=Penicillium nordicum TaxID=229535 RepID=A0A0M9W9K5_9EURO|nr:hypothetical protein ACN38_g12968 [Penicillium nordicum]